MKTATALFVALLILGGLVFSVWAHFDGSCELFKYSKAADVPARCVMKK